MTPVNDSKQGKWEKRRSQCQHYIFRVILVEPTFTNQQQGKAKRASEINNAILALATFKWDSSDSFNMWCQAKRIVRGKNVFWGKVGKGVINLKIPHLGNNSSLWMEIKEITGDLHGTLRQLSILVLSNSSEQDRASIALCRKPRPYRNHWQQMEEECWKARKGESLRDQNKKSP